jgi:hypothetical protein
LKSTTSYNQNHTPVWKSPLNWVLIAVGVVIFGSVYKYYQAPRAIGITYTDVSDSIQSYQAAVQQICEATAEQLMDEDIQIQAKFADRVVVENNATHQGGQTWEASCQQATKKPEGVGKQPGTDLVAALESMRDQIQHQRILGHKQVVVATLIIQAAEPKIGQKQADPQVVRELVQNIAKEGYLSIIGPEAFLQGQLNKELAQVPNVKVCTFDRAKACGVDWAFAQVRK